MEAETLPTDRPDRGGTIDYEAERERFAQHLADCGAKWSIDYAIRASTMADICNEFKACKRILELGAGYSTACLLETGADVFSYDHDPEWAAVVNQYVGLISPRKRRFSYIVATIGHWRSHIPAHARRYDGILVDHGPDMTDRLKDIPLIQQCLAPGGTIIFDDFKGGYKRQVLRKMRGYHIETRLDGSRHWGVAKRAIVIA